MAIPESQRETAALLRRLTGGGDPIETHISAVFVGPAEALKLKKAVALGFLDFSTLAARHHFAAREDALNRPNAPGLYRGITPVTREADGSLALGGAGAPVDWVVRMAAVPPGDFGDAIAARGGLTPALLDAIADTVAALHAAAPRVAVPDPAAAARAVLEGNVTSGHAAGLPAARVEAWAAAARARLAALAPVLAARAAEGRVRRCHGDLHLGNLCLWEGRPLAFDALEFDEALASIDTGYDFAFLLMDLECRGGMATEGDAAAAGAPPGRVAANRVLNRYVARSGDAGLVAGLPLWLSLRAFIRAHVEARRGREPAAYGLYLDAAEAYLRPSRPVLVAVGGLQGTGKSTLARRLAPGCGAAPGALVLRSDEIRKRRAGVPPETRLPATAYAESESLAVHAELFAAAARCLAAGHAAIADAVFLDPAHREAVAATARAAGVPFLGLWLEAPLDLLRARLEARRHDASDADAAVLARAARVDPGPLDGWARVDAAGDPLPAALTHLTRAGVAPC